MRQLILLSLLSICFSAGTQVPLKLWDSTIGGTGTELLRTAIPTADGGSLLVGTSNSPVGYDKTQPVVGSYDIWIVKLNAAGAVEWDKTYGTTTYDYIGSAAQGIDGNYLIAGYTSAGVSGDKTEAAIGGRDYWILRLDPAGNLLWQNTIGGTGDDYPTDVMPVAGGYVISGYSNSVISGDKTTVPFGAYDYWVFKLNNAGSIVWQYGYGGDANDYLRSTVQLADGTFLLCGDSESGISGVKTQPTNGSRDLWLVDMMGGGTIVWQKDIGSTGYESLGDLVELPAGGYLLVANSSGDIGGDKSQFSANTWVDCCEVGWGDGWWSNTTDHWIMRLDPTANIIWEKTKPVSSEEDAKRIFEVNDNRYCIAGDVWSEDSPSDLTFNTINEDGYSIYSEWFNGGLWWEDDEGGAISYTNGNSYMADGFLAGDGGFVIATYSDALAGDYKSEDCIGVSDYSDYWIIKMAPDTGTLVPLYSDYDQDGSGGSIVSYVAQNNAGYTLNPGPDCNDMHSSVSAVAAEICDGMDNDCNGLIDDGLIDCGPVPAIAWDKTYGDDSLDYVHDICQVTDGYVLVGSRSIYALDYPEETFIDYAVRKIDDAGNEIWFRYISGDSWDYGKKIVACADGNILVAGSTYSGMALDKTEPSMGSLDLWILMLDPDGNIIWQNTIGGAQTDELADIKQTADGGFILTAKSYSGFGGDKTESNYGNADVWVIKLNADGTIAWQNSTGGVSTDEPASIVQTTDGGYIIGVESSSGISGEKTVVGYGSSDYWIIKLNPDGTIQWQRSFGGAGYEEMAKVMQTPEGDYVIFGNSQSGVSALKSEASINADLWVIKINAAGTVLWENTIQGLTAELANDIELSPSDGYILLASSDSDMGYDKIESKIRIGYIPYSVETAYIKHDYWLLQLDTSGNIEWQNVIGGNFNDDPEAVLVNDAGDIMVAGWSESYASGDKSTDNHGDLVEIFYEDEWYETPIRFDRDGWVVYLDYTCTPSEELCNGLDDDCDGLLDDDVLESVSIAAAGPITFCQGGSVVLNSDYTGATVQWKKNGIDIPGATGETYTATLKGNYTCVTNSDCGSAESSPLYVNVLKNPAALIVAGGPTTFCAGGSVVLTANTGVGLSYQWYNGPTAIAGATAFTYTATTEGTYKCRVTKTATGCNKLSNGIIVTVPCKAGMQLSTNSLIAYPVPATHAVSIEGCSPHTPLYIYDGLGQLVLTIEPAESRIEIDITKLAPGLYVVRSGEAVSEFIKQ